MLLQQMKECILAPEDAQFVENIDMRLEVDSFQLLRYFRWMILQNLVSYFGKDILPSGADCTVSELQSARANDGDEDAHHLESKLLRIYEKALVKRSMTGEPELGTVESYCLAIVHAYVEKLYLMQKESIMTVCNFPERKRVTIMSILSKIRYGMGHGDVTMKILGIDPFAFSRDVQEECRKQYGILMELQDSMIVRRVRLFLDEIINAGFHEYAIREKELTRVG